MRLQWIGWLLVVSFPYHPLLQNANAASSQQQCPEALTPDATHLWWGTQVWSASCCASSLAPLRHAILALERSEKGNVKSNVGGWQSKAGAFESVKTLPGIEKVRTAVYELVAQYVARITPRHAGGTLHADVDTSWININRHADMNRPHTHSGFASGVFYVDSGGSHANESLLCFLDPRAQARQAALGWAEAVGNGWMETETMCKIPRAGLLVLFPAWLDHYVLPLRGPGPRISISFNVALRFPPHTPSASRGEPLMLQVPSKHGGRKIILQSRG